MLDPPTPFGTPCLTPKRVLMHTHLSRSAYTQTPARRGETVKPVFIKDRAASSMELIAAAQAELPQEDGEYIV